MRKRQIVFLLLLGFILISIQTISFAAEPNGCLSESEAELVQLINDYRNANGLPLTKTPILTAGYRPSNATINISTT